MNGVTGRMGMNQHLIRSIVAIRARAASRSRTATRSCPIRSWSAATPRRSRRSRSARHRALDHRPRRRARQTRTTRLLRRRRRRRCARRSSQGDRRRQAHLLREAGRDDARPRRSTRALAKQRRQARRGAGQAVPARPAQARMLRDSGFFGRILSVRGEFGYWVFEGDWGSRRSGRRGTTARRTAAASSSTCCATGATCSTTCSARCRRELPRRDAHPERWDENGKPYKATADDAAYATFELEGRRHRAHQHRRGRRACAATTSSRSRSTARTARRSPGCRRLRDQRASTRRGRCGIRTCRRRSTSSTPGRKCRTTSASTTTASRPVGDVHPPRRRGRAVPLDAARRRQGRAARRARR
jgi:hypothetical protein